MAEWYYSQNGQQFGPVSGAVLRQLTVTGQVRPFDLAWSEGMAGWQPVSAVPALSSPAGGAPGPVGPPPMPGYNQPGYNQPGYGPPEYAHPPYAAQGYPGQGYAAPGYAAPGYGPGGYGPPMGRREWLVAVLLCFFLGGLGAHRFYTGHIGIGIVQLLTLGGCGIWSMVDFILILCDNYRDADGYRLARR